MLSTDSLLRFFEPTSVAVVGASADPEKAGHQILKNIVESGHNRKIFPVNPKAPEILGLKAYPSIRSIPIQIDFVLIAVPSNVVPKVVEECAEKGVKAVVIVSGGFREAGEQGRHLEKVMLETAKKADVRIIGPNCQGVNDPYSGLSATWGYFTRLPGPIAVVAQSGTIAGTIQCWADRERIGISKCVNLGNRIDVDEADLLQFLKEDDKTRAIALHLEGVADGRMFMKTASQVSRVKPIVVLKGGTTKTGRKATLSHTSSLAGNAEIFDAALKQAGVTKANTLEEFYDLAKAFALLPLPKGPGVLIIESTGGAGVLAADMCEKLGLILPVPSERAKIVLRRVLSSVCTFDNPFDLATECFNTDNFRKVIEENSENDEINAFITIFGDPLPGAAEAVKKAAEKTDKPIFVAYFGGGEVEDRERVKMYDMKIPVFSSPERAVIALNALVRRAQRLSKEK